MPRREARRISQSRRVLRRARDVTRYTRKTSQSARIIVANGGFSAHSAETFTIASGHDASVRFYAVAATRSFAVGRRSSRISRRNRSNDRGGGTDGSPRELSNRQPRWSPALNRCAEPAMSNLFTQLAAAPSFAEIYERQLVAPLFLPIPLPIDDLHRLN